LKGRGFSRAAKEGWQDSRREAAMTDQRLEALTHNLELLSLETGKSPIIRSRNSAHL